MTFHVVALPHTQTTREYVHCAYTEKVRKFCNMMTSLGHIVYLYASEDNEANCKERITCITKKQQKDMIGVEKPTDNLKAEFDPNKDYWQLMNDNAIAAIKDRIQPKDFICVIAGLCQKPIADAFPDHMTVEYGIGYGGVFAKYKVFESYAWMHTVYGSLMGTHSANGNYYDCVIPNYYDISDFPFSDIKDDYFLFIGRLIDRKGYQIAVDVCKYLNKKLVIAGQGDPPEYGEYVGVVGAKERGKLMSKAKAVFVPTQYIGPFEGVSVEANLCGTPIITTDWGSFAENNIDGLTGWRCRTFKEFVAAARNVDGMDYKCIRDISVDKYDCNNVKYKYQTYFHRLLTLWDKGWYEI